MKITVYTLPSCVQCGAVKRRLDSEEVDYSVKHLRKHEETLEAFKDRGILQAPVTVLESVSGVVLDEVLGNDPDGLTRLIAAASA